MSPAPAIKQPFFVPSNSPGIIRGGWFDEAGGMLVGLHAQWVCDTLNKAITTKSSEVPPEGIVVSVKGSIAMYKIDGDEDGVSYYKIVRGAS